MTQKRGKAGEAKSDVVRDIPAAVANETLAVEFLERMRWGDVPACPRCGDTNVRKMESEKGERNARFLWRCLGCKKQYTVKVGTVMEDSRIPHRCWVYALWRATSSKKGASAMEIKRQTGLSYKSALFLMHRVRAAMATDWSKEPPLSGTVLSDETYIGGRPRYAHKGADRAMLHKSFVVAVVAEGGKLRAATIPSITARNVGRVLHANVAPTATLHTDESTVYGPASKYFADHETVNHSKGEYARGDVSTNRVEGWFSLLKRGLTGTFHSVSRKHLGRYVSEFEFRYNWRHVEDGTRLQAVMTNGEGKRLDYRTYLQHPTHLPPRPTWKRLARLKDGERPFWKRPRFLPESEQ